MSEILKRCPVCGGKPQWVDGLENHSVSCACGLHTFGYETRREAAQAWNRVVEACRRPGTCRYEPETMACRYDEDDNEIDTDEPAWDCSAFVCSECGELMMFGDSGWFDIEPPYRPHFDYCPYCGRVVEGSKGYASALRDAPATARDRIEQRYKSCLGAMALCAEAAEVLQESAGERGNS